MFENIGNVQETMDHFRDAVNEGDAKAVIYLVLHEDEDGTLSYGWSGNTDHCGASKYELLGMLEVCKRAIMDTFDSAVDCE